MIQQNLPFIDPDAYNIDNILTNVESLVSMRQAGLLGGETMPEDARPDIINEHSADNYHFLTLPMSLNYQRNSYSLWQSAAKTYIDNNCRDVFSPVHVARMTEEELREKLLKYKVALQPNKHVNTWMRISRSIVDLLDGDVRMLFDLHDNDVVEIRQFVQKQHKKSFPYLSGEKICNYWLYVIDTYTPLTLRNRGAITVAPDTHVLQASIKLGLVRGDIDSLSKDRTMISEKWSEVLKGTNLAPIDVHTPLWLWSRAGFPTIVNA